MSKLGYTWYPKDFASDPDVMLMSSAERGIYRDLIDLAYMTGNCIKYSYEALARYTNGNIEDVKTVLNMKGECNDGVWKIPSCDKRMNLIEKNKSNGAKGGRPSKDKPKQNPEQNPNTNPNDNPEQNPTTDKIITQTERQREIEREREKESKIERDSVFENSVLNFFDLTESVHFQQAQTLNAFVYVQTLNGRLDHFKKQFADYSKLKSDKKFVHSFQNFIGDQKEQFSNGIWDSQNWGAKLKAANDTPAAPSNQGYIFGQKPRGAVNHA